MKVTVFGGANPKPDEPAYAEAQELGRLLGEAGHTVLTGGYMGTMEAVSRGAAGAGAHVIGVTCSEIETWRGARANPWVREEWKQPTLRDRLAKLIENGEALVALPGGAGTLAEISLAWNLMIIQSIPARLLVLVGPAWQDIFTRFFEQFEIYVHPKDRLRLVFAPDVQSVVSLLTQIPATIVELG